MRKSPGPDDIVTEMLVAAGDMGIAELKKTIKHDVHSMWVSQ